VHKLWKTDGREALFQVTDAGLLWTTCRDVLQEDVSEAVWKTWFEGIEADDLVGSLFTLSTPSHPVRERLEDRYLSLIEQTASKIAENDLEIRFVVRPAPPQSLLAAEPYEPRRPVEALTRPVAPCPRPSRSPGPNPRI